MGSSDEEGPKENPWDETPVWGGELQGLESLPQNIYLTSFSAPADRQCCVGSTAALQPSHMVHVMWCTDSFPEGSPVLCAGALRDLL